MSIKCPNVTVLLLLVQLGHTKHCSMYKCICFGIFLEIKISGAVNPSTSHSQPVGSMFNEIVQFLKLFMFFPGVLIMTSAS